jgi:four helix bundle protein
MQKDDSKRHDLEERTFEFAKASRAFVKKQPRTIGNIEDAKQFIRASGSIGANYIEANESIGKKDFVMKIKTWRREAGKRLLAAFARLQWRTRLSKSEAFNRSAGTNKYFRCNRPQNRTVNLNFEFGICFGLRISNFGF